MKRYVITMVIAISSATTAFAQLSDHSLFEEPPVKDGGWQGLANVLKKLEPSVDTRLPLTPSQITDKIRNLIDSGQTNEALEVIEKRKQQRKEYEAIGEDVQLLFLEGRAYSVAGQTDKAIQHYQNMTIKYPELPEPWNNLAVEYAKQNKLEMAEKSLETALASDSDYTEARYNLGIVQLMIAQKTLDQANKSGYKNAGSMSSAVDELLQKH